MERLDDIADDRLEVYSLVVGAFLVITAIGTLVGQPWATNPSVPNTLVQLVGVGAVVGVGGGLIWLGRQ
ncbi:MAG: hypothetical protein ABEJ86_07210 [Halococcoides sp.]